MHDERNEHCPCGSKKLYQDCCGPFHDGTEIPESAESLMRSRYSAYALKNLDYIMNTMIGRASKDFVRENAEHSQRFTKWLGLDVLKSVVDSKNPSRAFVEFRALFDVQGKCSVLHELSEFVQVDGRWLYTDGKTQKGSRNDLCPCHSGKKFKRCHGAG